MASTRNYEAFIEKMRMEGVSAYDASQFPEAREAHQLDQKVDWNNRVSMRKEHYKPTKADGSPMTTFENADQLKAALRDPLYAASSEYRAKVKEMMAGMIDGETGLITGDAAKGYGDQHHIENEAMLRGATRDAARSEYSRLAKESATDPMKRLQLIQLMQSDDPEVKAWMGEGEASLHNEGALNRAMREKGHGSVGPDLGKALAGGQGDNNELA